MKRLVFVCLSGLLAGCFSSSSTTGTGAPVRDVPVVVASGYSLDQAVLAAAAFRRWTPAKTADNTYRLTISQRGNLCVVDVVLSNGSFSILPVESNIPTGKYDQWVNNLQREILMRAQRGR